MNLYEGTLRRLTSSVCRLQERKRRHAERGDQEVDAAAPIPESRPQSGMDDGSDDSGSGSDSDRRRCAPRMNV